MVCSSNILNAPYPWGLVYYILSLFLSLSCTVFWHPDTSESEISSTDMSAFSGVYNVSLFWTALDKLQSLALV